MNVFTVSCWETTGHTLISVLVHLEPFNLGVTAQRGDIMKGVYELNKGSKGGVKRLTSSHGPFSFINVKAFLKKKMRKPTQQVGFAQNSKSNFN